MRVYVRLPLFTRQLLGTEQGWLKDPAGAVHKIYSQGNIFTIDKYKKHLFTTEEKNKEKIRKERTKGLICSIYIKLKYILT